MSTKKLTRRERKRTERIEAILDAAMVLLRDGTLTMARLAEAQDCAVGALYRYFPGKAAVIAGLQLRAIDRYTTVLQEGLQPVETVEGAVDQLRWVAGSWAAFASTEPELYALINGSLSSPEAELDDDLAAAVDAHLSGVLGVIAAVLERAAAVGAIHRGDAVLRTHVLWAAIHGVGHFAKRDRIVGPTLQSAVIREALVSTLIAGWS